MTTVPPPHFDDETLSGLLDGEPAPAGDHLAACAACRARLDLLGEARALLAAPLDDDLDELTRRRLLSRAMDSAPAPAGPVAGDRWYRRPAVLGGIAAAVAVILAVPVINNLSRSGNDDSSSAAPAAAIAAPESATQGDLATRDLGDLGEVSEALIRERFAAAADGSASGEFSAQEPPPQAAGAPAATPAAASKASPGDERDAEESAPSPSPVALDNTSRSGADQAADTDGGGRTRASETTYGPGLCVDALLAGPAAGGQLRASATGTLRGTPVAVVVFDTAEGGAVAYVAATDGCAVLEAYTL